MIPRDEIVSIAREAGFSVRGETIRTMHSSGAWVGINDELAKFAALAITRHLAHSPPQPLVVSMSDVDQAQLAAMLDKRQPMPLVAAPDDSKLATERAARQEAQAMAECLDMLRTDLIAAEVIGPDVAPMFLTEAVLSAVSKERTARIEAQQRLADAQELAAKAGLAHRMAVQRCVQAAVAEAVAAEREACVKFVRSFDTAMTDKIANELLLARGAA